MQITWSNELVAELHDDLYEIYKNEWWTKDRAKSDVIQAFQHSDVVVLGLDSDGKLIAFARVLSDFTFKAVIFDLIIDKNYRKMGLGVELVEKILTNEKLKSVQSFELYCPDHIAPFYEKLGFQKNTSNLLKMLKN